MKAADVEFKPNRFVTPKLLPHEAHRSTGIAAQDHAEYRRGQFGQQ